MCDFFPFARNLVVLFGYPHSTIPLHSFVDKQSVAEWTGHGCLMMYNTI